MVVIGGSYPGALSAWFREKYPHLTVASWASSGVVYPIADLWKFDEQIYTATSKSSKECPATIQTITKNVEDALSDPGQLRNEVMKTAGADPGMDNGDFAFYFADIFVESVQYGSRTQLCKLMSEIKDKDLSEQLHAIKSQADKSGVAPSDYCRKALKNTTIIDSPGRPWTYQYCTEFGFWQVPSHEHPMRSTKFLNTEYWTSMCKDIFGTTLHINRTIDMFSFHKVAPTHTIFTNGADDPW